MKLLFFKSRISTSLLSRKAYYTVNVASWCYAIAWLVSLCFLWYYWEIPLWGKIALNFTLIMFTPALRDLAKSYGQYKREWEQEHGMRSG